MRKFKSYCWYNIIFSVLFDMKFYILRKKTLQLTFGVVPQHLRIAFIAVVSFFWLIIFSSLTAKSQKERDSVDVDDTCSLEDGMTCKIDG
jgi:hypothetical protein